MKRKFRGCKLLSISLSLFLLASCSNSAIQSANETQPAADSSGSIKSSKVIKVTNDMITYDTDDNYTLWKNQNPTYVKLNGATATLTGPGAEVQENKVTIATAGTYVISGKMNDGQIIVDSKDKGTVRLVLNGAEINSSNSAPVYIKNADKAVLSLEEGTDNTLNDGKNYTLDDTANKEPDSAVFSKSNLTINGTGKLTVNANYNDGISSKDDLKIIGGSISINSKDDAIVGKDMVLVKDGSITVKAGGDGIKSTNDTDEKKGFIVIQGGTFNLTTQTDGIQAETSMLITNGNINILSGGGSANGTKKSGDDRKAPGRWENNTETESTETETPSAKGLKAESYIDIAGGTFKLDTSDDAIHSSNSATVSDGDITIASGDDGIHADSNIDIKNGKINITKSYEGIESMVLTIADGEINITSDDDGININGGNDGSAGTGGPGGGGQPEEAGVPGEPGQAGGPGQPGQGPDAVSANSMLYINGGNISVNASGDGLDSNGSVVMTNGKVFVSGPTSNNNGAIDYNGTFKISGGLLIAAGSSGMAQAPSEESTQYSINMNFPNLQEAGTIVHLQDSKGNTVATYAPEKEYQSVVISSPLLKKDSSYSLYTGGSLTGGVYKAGTKLIDFKATGSVTWLDENGVTTQKSFGPGGGRGFGHDGGFKGPDKQQNSSSK
ncbi:carbohydrate-binding domain-containing protein [Ruminiclostridium papyrosolvens]|uniref:Dockerin type 1 n=1 Tax=Ruminiclostridium papyrosolvens C7 TaxID=1330534 RepID=U4R0V5_9FIRM|nr:carbohydrate-binding domain-containing protein [Ruminiclostridium papyrosolvens]EPR10383.1 hypothetical protein L323_13330 [Ruminiclostridium papyrosolvens C7]